MESLSRTRWLLALLFLAFTGVGCSWEWLYRIYPIPFYDTHARVTRTPGLSENPSRRIAVLPFTFTQKDNPERRQAALLLREALSVALRRVRAYDVITATEVDRRLEAAGITAQTLLAQTPESLGQIAGADTLLYGDLERTANITLYVYSHTVYEGTFRLVDAAGGEPLWSARLWEGRRAGLLVEGFIVDMFISQPENRNRPETYRTVAENMVSKLIATIPEPALAGTTPVAPAREKP